MRLRRRTRNGGEFRIEARHRELIAYWEGDRAVVFDAGWGVKPPELYVPTDEVWDDVVPDWLKGRRDVVIDRLVADSGHRIVETDDPMRQELRPVTSAEEAHAIAANFLDSARGIIGPWEIERLEETQHGWQVAYRHLEPSRYSPAIPDGRSSLLVRRDTGEVRV